MNKLAFGFEMHHACMHKKYSSGIDLSCYVDHAKCSCIYIEAGILCSPPSFNFPLHTSIIATFVPTKVPQMKGNKEGPRQRDKKQSLKEENEKKRTNDHTMCAIFIYLQRNACIITAHIYTLRNHVEMCHGSIKPCSILLKD